MATSERWVVALETGALWLHERVDGEALDRLVTLEQLASGYPRLAAEFKRTRFRDTPFVVVER